MENNEDGQVKEISARAKTLISSQFFPLFFSNLFGFLLVLGLMYPGDWNKEAKFVNICLSCVPLIIGIYNLGTEANDRRFVSFSLSSVVLGFLTIIGVLYLH